MIDLMTGEEPEIQDSEQAIDWLQLSKDAYHSSKPYLDAFLRPQWEKNIRQWQGKHRVDSKYESDQYGRTKLFRPRTRAVIRKNEAAAAVAYFSTQDVVNISATNDNDPLDQLTADIANELLNQRLTKTIPWFQTVIGAFQTAQIYGEVISYQYWDKKKDQPCIDLIAPENFRIDPASDWIDPIGTSPYLIHLIPMYVMDVKEYDGWNTPDEKAMQSAAKEDNDPTRLTREKTDTKSDNDNIITAYSVVWVRRYVIKKGGMDWVFYTLGDNFMLSDPMPLQEAYWHGERPYVRGISILEAFTPHPSGVPELVADVQAEINDTCNLRMDNVKFALNKRYFVKKGTQVDLRSLTRNIPGSVTLMNDPATDVLVQNTPDVTSSSYQEQDRLNLDFDDLAGTFSGSSVQANRKLNETVGGMEMLSQSGNAVAEYQLKTFNETWVEPTLRQLVKLELLYESDQNILKLAGEKSELFMQQGFEVVTTEMLQGNFTLNVNVGTGAANPELQIKQFFYGLQTLATINPDIVMSINTEEVVKEVFGKLGYKDGKRFFSFDANPQVQQLTQQIQQLQQELANKRNPAIDAATVKLTDAQRVKTLNEAQYNAMQAAATLVGMPGAASVADVIMQNSGYQLPTPNGVDPNYPVVSQAHPIPDMPVSPNIGQQQGIETTRVTDNI
jgi:hypothetical protein